MSDRGGNIERSDRNSGDVESTDDYGPRRTRTRVPQSQSKPPKKRSASKIASRKSKHRRKIVKATITTPSMAPIHETDENDANEYASSSPIHPANNNSSRHPSFQDSVNAYGEGDREYRRTKLLVKGSGGVNDRFSNVGNVSRKIRMFEQEAQHVRSGEQKDRAKHQYRRDVLCDETGEVVNTETAASRYRHSPTSRKRKSPARKKHSRVETSSHRVDNAPSRSTRHKASTSEIHSNNHAQYQRHSSTTSSEGRSHQYSRNDAPRNDYGPSHNATAPWRIRHEDSEVRESNDYSYGEDDDLSDSRRLDVDDDGFDTVITPSVPILPPPRSVQSSEEEKCDERNGNRDGAAMYEENSGENSHTRTDGSCEISLESQSREVGQDDTPRETLMSAQIYVAGKKAQGRNKIPRKTPKKAQRPERATVGRNGNNRVVYVVFGLIGVASLSVIVPVNVYQSSKARAAKNPTLSPAPSMAPSSSLYPSSFPSTSAKPSLTPSFMPSVSQEPSVSALPSSSPSLSPSVSLMPSIRPSVSLVPSTSPTVSLVPSYRPNVSLITRVSGESSALSRIRITLSLMVVGMAFAFQLIV